MEEINLKELFDYFKERIMLFIIIVLSVLVLGSVYSILIKTPLYQSSSKLQLIDGNVNSVTNYKEVVKSQKVVEPVIKELNLNYSAETLKEHITITNEANSTTMIITVEDKDSLLAKDIATEVTKAFKTEMKEMYSVKNIVDLDVPYEASNPYNMSVTKDLLIYVCIGVILGLAVIFVIYYFDTTIKSSEEVEKKFNLPIFGIVPKVKGKEK